MELTSGNTLESTRVISGVAREAVGGPKIEALQLTVQATVPELSQV